MTRVLIRADASATIGNGHVMRCLALARAWRAAGASVAFACRDHPANLCDRLQAEGFSVYRLPMGARDDGAAPDPLAHASWLGADWHEDAAAVAAAIEASPSPPDWLVVDHYALDRRWEDALRARVGALLVIDDLADREHGPCLLLDQNFAADLQTRHAGRVAEPSRWLLGPRYALLREEFARLHPPSAARAQAPRRVLLHFGGGPDPFDIAGRALGALRALAWPGLEADIVAGSSAGELRKRFGADARIRIHDSVESLAPFAAAADLAIGAAGVAALERLCLGLPSLVLSMAENQRAGAEEMARQQLVLYLGHHDAIDDVVLREAIRAALAALPDPAWVQRCLDAVDGRGVERVLAAIAQGPAPALHARLATAEDEQRLLDWANDPHTRANAFSPGQIPLADHRRWLHVRLADPECRLYVVEARGEGAIGTVRLQRESQGWEVHFNLAAQARGRGLGRGLVSAGLQALAAETGGTALVFGRVKAGNQASCRVFEGLGFVRQATPVGEPLEFRNEG